MTTRWYGEEPAFRAALEGPARARYGRHLSVSLYPDRFNPSSGQTSFGPLVFRLDGVQVRGRLEPEKVEIWFRADVPIARAAGIPEHDFPSIYDRSDSGPHRHADGGLCLYFPYDRPELRWTIALGLPSLFDLAAEHLYFEDYYRRHENVWLGREAPHDLPRGQVRRDAFGQETS